MQARHVSRNASRDITRKNLNSDTDQDVGFMPVFRSTSQSNPTKMFSKSHTTVPMVLSSVASCHLHCAYTTSFLYVGVEEGCVLCMAANRWPADAALATVAVRVIPATTFSCMAYSPIPHSTYRASRYAVHQLFDGQRHVRTLWRTRSAALASSSHWFPIWFLARCSCVLAALRALSSLSLASVRASIALTSCTVRALFASSSNAAEPPTAGRLCRHITHTTSASL